MQVISSMRTSGPNLLTAWTPASLAGSGMPVRRRFLVASAGLLMSTFVPAASAARLTHGDIGLILMHGKWGRTPGPLAPYFEREGYRVSSPEMPWSGRRLYDVEYGAGLDEVHREVATLRAAGAKKVIVGGTSFGANGALAYQAVHGDADALILLAPGHMPGGWYGSGFTRGEVDQAETLSRAGKGDERFSFTDYNQSNSRRLSARADVYLSYFFPRGLGNMKVSAGRLSRPVPVLVVNSANEVKSQGRSFIFEALPLHPKNVYLESSMEHGAAADGARADVQRFIDSVTDGWQIDGAG